MSGQFLIKNNLYEILPNSEFLSLRTKELNNADKKEKCKLTLAHNIKRVDELKAKLSVHGLHSNDLVIVVANTSNELGETIVSALMEDTDWGAYRAKQQFFFVAFAMPRFGMKKIIELVEIGLLDKFDNCPNIPVIIIDWDVIEIFSTK